VTWSLSPVTGTISSSGLYKAPATIGSRQTVIVKATSRADTSKAASATVTLNPPATPPTAQYTLSFSWLNSTALQVSWTAPPGRPTTDYIVLTSPGAPDWWNIWSQSTRGARTGSFVLNKPASLGLYEFRYYLENTYTLAARSSWLALGVSGFSVRAAPATVARGATVTVVWTAPAGRPVGWTDYIGLFKMGTPSDQPISYVYTKGATSGTYTATAPGTSGTYEFRYLLAGDNYINAAQTQLTVQ
jgi:hypothetical protein